MRLIFSALIFFGAPLIAGFAKDGQALVMPLRSFSLVLPIIRHHHERIDGSGYPDRLEGDAIPLTARVLSVVDVFDALTTDRPYHAACSQEEALAEMAGEVDKG